jgi:hypothetical protein
MIELPKAVIDELTRRDKFIIPVVEFYSRDVEDFASLSSPANAYGRFSDVCYTWNNTEGSYLYESKVLSWPEISLYLGKDLNTAEVEFINVKRGPDSMTSFVLDNKVKGSWMVIRLLYPDQPNEHNIIFWGKCSRPGEINNETVSITATQDLGNSKQEIPFRNYATNCPVTFGKPQCLGNETLEEKSTAYQNAFALYSTAGCNKLFSTCKAFENDKFFQGQRVVAVSGQFSYITVEEVVKRVLFWTKRKKIQTVKTDNWSSVNQSEDSEVVPLAFGRCQIQGHPFTWADQGTQVYALQGFCEGPISAYTFIRSRVQGINIVGAPVEHLGEWGGTGTQVLDRIFGGSSGYNSRLAYLEVITNGSSPTQVDGAPLITAVVRGLVIPVPDVDGTYSITDWTHNPVHITRYIMTDDRFGKIPLARMDDVANLETAYDCEEIIEDRTNEEFIVLPSNEINNYNVGYRRFRSTGRLTATRLRWSATGAQRSTLGGEAAEQIESIPLVFPEWDDPEIRWFNPFQPYVLPPPRSVLREKYTFNGALQEKVSILDFLYERVLPTFKGYIAYSPNGKIQIKNRRKADNGYIRAKTRSGKLEVPVTNVLPWRANTSGYLLIGVSLETAEIRQVTGITYAPACSGTSIVADIYGDLEAEVSDIDEGSENKPGEGFVIITGEPVANDEVKVTIGEGDDAFYISYIADGSEDLTTFTLMLASFMNANVQFKESFYAYIPPAIPNKIVIVCVAGYLKLDKYLEYDHDLAEEVLRVQAVFENCGELTANMSAQFDNIGENTFKWNLDEEDEINALTAKYTSAVDDFHLTNILPRAGWDTIDLEGELLKDELDLTFIDNYWQAAYITKGEAIDKIDGNLHFSLETGMLSLRLELGDVVAVRHDSGEGALNYTPCWITKNQIDLNEFKVTLGMKLYLSAAFDYHVQPIEPLLTTTLNTVQFPQTPPETTGTSGGVSRSSEPVVFRPGHQYYDKFATIGKYSPDGKDIT